MKMKTECNDLQSIFNLYSVEYSTKSMYLMFKVINIIVFYNNVLLYYEFDACITFQASSDREQQNTGKVVESSKNIFLKHSTGKQVIAS